MSTYFLGIPDENLNFFHIPPNFHTNSLLHHQHQRQRTEITGILYANVTITSFFLQQLILSLHEILS